MSENQDNNIISFNSINMRRHIDTLKEHEEYIMEALRQFYSRLREDEDYFHKNSSFELTKAISENIINEIETVGKYIELHRSYASLLRSIKRQIKE